MRVSVIGFGGWGIGNTCWIGADERSSVQALIAAADAGITFFDTALVYGKGRSERLIARVFGKSEEVIIASKVPPLNGAWPAMAGTPLRDVFPLCHVLDCLRKTLANLQREFIHLYQFHVWSDEWASDPEWLELIEKLRNSGRVRAIGISINDHQPENVLQALGTRSIDCIQVIYNVFDQSAEEHLFPYCMKHNVGVIARAPFDEGSLAGQVRPESSFPHGDFREQYFSGNRKLEVWERIQKIASDANIPLAQLPEVALRFCTSHPAVSTVIPGMRNAHHVLSNAAAGSRGTLPRSMVQTLHNHRWSRNFYVPPAAPGHRQWL